MNMDQLKKELDSDARSRVDELEKEVRQLRQELSGKREHIETLNRELSGCNEELDRLRSKLRKYEPYQDLLDKPIWTGNIGLDRQITRTVLNRGGIDVD